MRSKLAIIYAALAIALLVLLSALFAWQQNSFRSEVAQASEPASQLRLGNRAGEVRFSHPRHGTASCGDCHHKTSDPSPYRSCHDCHQGKGGKILNSQAAFHQTCIRCHEQALKGNKQAPSRRCGSCHR